MLRKVFNRVRFPVVGSHSLIPQHVPVFYNAKLSGTVPKEEAFLNQVNRINELTRELEQTKAEKLKRVEIELAPAKAELLRAQAELLLVKAELLPDQAELLRIEPELLPLQAEVLQAEAKAVEAEAEAEKSRAYTDAVYMEFIGNNDAYDENEKLRIKMRLDESREKFCSNLKSSE